MSNTPNTMHYMLVLDRSGSMARRMEDVVGAVNEQVTELRATVEETGKQCLVSLVRFDNDIESVFEDQDVRSLPPITLKDVRPRGSTSLIDATVTSIERTAERTLAATFERTASVAMIVYTDGGENSSRLRNSDDLKRALATFQNLPGWDIAFIGADPSAISTMDRAGFDQRKMAYVQAENSHHAMRRMSASLRDKLAHEREFSFGDDFEDLK